MIAFPPAETLPAAVLAELAAIGDRLQAASPADTVACAYGVGHDVRAWYDDSEGRYFDLASLTKPLFSAPTVLGLLAAPGALDEPAAEILSWLPRVPGTPTVRALLTHASGLPSELPPHGDASEVRTWVGTQIRDGSVPGERVLYSDVNYWLLGELAGAWTGEPLPALFARAPTAASGAFSFAQAPADRSVAAGPVVGSAQLPHDPAARRLGPSGHAGAFGTLAGVVDAVVSWLDGTWLPEPLAAEAVTCQTHATPGGHRSLAWTLAGDPFHVVAHDWPPTTLSHTGFTGVSVALDPVSRWWAVYLSNAIPAGRDATPILVARRHFHAAAAAHLRATTRAPSSPRTEEGREE
jgi:CubicO group peptidase (beta-lactamase class C family)